MALAKIVNNYDNLVTTTQESIAQKKEMKTKIKKKGKNYDRDTNRELPCMPSCKHAEKGFNCMKLNKEEIADFQNKFYDRGSKVRQDIFILRHCAVSAPKRCRSKEGIPRKSHIVHFYIPLLSGSLVAVCRKTFTEILGIRNGRVKGVITRYIESKKIPTENRGGNRQSQKFQKKFQSVHDFLSNLQGVMMSCDNCGAKKVSLSPDQDVKKLWLFYNSKSSCELKVFESYFRSIFMKYFNISFGNYIDKEKDRCFQCLNNDKKSESSKKETTISENEIFELKVLEMSYPPGEHFLFAPLPNNRDPITNTVWKNGDNLPHSTNGICNEENTMQSSSTTECQEIGLQNIFQTKINSHYHKESDNRNQTIYPHTTDINHCNTFTSNQIIITDQAYDNGQFSRIDYIGQSYPYGSLFLNRDVSSHNHAEQTTTAREITNDSEQVYHDSIISYQNSQHQVHTNSYVVDDFKSNRDDVSSNVSGSNKHDSSSTKRNGTIPKRKPLHKCVPCKLTFNSDLTYNEHKNEHFNKKILKCKHCERTFFRRDSFSHHIRSHTVKVHKCSLCHMAFNHLINLQIHTERQHPI